VADIEAVREQNRSTDGVVVAGALVATFLLWQVSDLSPLVYPFRLFVTLVHELGHGLAAMLTGGRFIDLEVMHSGAGLARYAGGSRFVVIQAGYLGAAMFGSILLILVNKARDPRFLTAIVGLLCGGMAFALGANVWTRAIGLVVLLAMLVLVWQTPPWLKRRVENADSVLGRLAAFILRWRGPIWLNRFALNLLAMMVSLNAVLDIWWLMGSLDTYVGAIPNDAQAMARETHISAQVWALLWIVLSVVMLAGAIYLTFIRPVRRARRQGVWGDENT
jgi:hypothetical protein